MTKLLLIVAVLIGGWWLLRRPRRRPATSFDAAFGEAEARAEARAVLGVDAAAGPDAIRAAHRRLVSAVHPDKGGSADLTRRINAARDVLLKRR